MPVESLIADKRFYWFWAVGHIASGNLPKFTGRLILGFCAQPDPSCAYEFGAQPESSWF
jgi:hypothetical protein